MPHTRSTDAKKRRSTARKGTEVTTEEMAPAAKRGRQYGLGERNPATLGHESLRETRYSTGRWASIRKAIMAPGGGYGIKSTGYGR